LFVIFPVFETTGFITFPFQGNISVLTKLNPASTAALLTAVALAKEVAEGDVMM
jgi:hypothetical protein